MLQRKLTAVENELEVERRTNEAMIKQEPLKNFFLKNPALEILNIKGHSCEQARELEPESNLTTEGNDLDLRDALAQFQSNPQPNRRFPH